MKRGVDIALELGVDLLRVFSGSARDDVSQDEGEAWILEGLASGAAYAESRNVTLALGESRALRRAQRSGARHHRAGGFAGAAG